jgi:hypothetical protein
MKVITMKYPATLSDVEGEEGSIKMDLTKGVEQKSEPDPRSELVILAEVNNYNSNQLELARVILESSEPGTEVFITRRIISGDVEQE